MSTLPLLVFDTNIMMDVLLQRGGDAAITLLELAEQTRVELALPEYVLFEFRGTALRWIRDELERLNGIRRPANEWLRSKELGSSATEIKRAAADIERRLERIRPEVDLLISRVRSVAHVIAHTPEIHHRGDIRYLEGRPPDRPVDGLKDCRIYEAVLSIAESERSKERPKFLVTRDSDFDFPELVEELATLGFHIRRDPGRLYGELISRY